MAESEHTRKAREAVEAAQARWRAAVVDLDDDTSAQLKAAAIANDRDEVMRIVGEGAAQAREVTAAWEAFERASNALMWARVADEIDPPAS